MSQLVTSESAIIPGLWSWAGPCQWRGLLPEILRENPGVIRMHASHSRPQFGGS